MSATLQVLIVEDVDAMRELLAQLVGQIARYKVSGLARNAAEARFELLRRRPDLVLLDEILPGESSLDLLEELRQQGIAVVLLTSLASRSAEKPQLPEGALARILKPGWKTLAADAVRIQGELDEALDGRG